MSEPIGSLHQKKHWAIVLVPPRTGMSVRHTLPRPNISDRPRLIKEGVKKRRQGGFTSVEMVLVSMLVLAVMALVVKQAAVLNDDSKATAAMGNVRSISSVIQSRLGDRDNFAEVSNTVVHSFLPQGVLTFDGTAFVSPFSTTINVRPTAIEGVTASGYEVDVLSVPTRACTTMAIGLSGEFEEISIDRTVVKAGGIEVKPVVQDVINACAGGTHRLRFKGAG